MTDTDAQALSQTPCERRIDGFWRITDQTDKGPIISSCRIRQSGVVVEGLLQGKFAAAAPLIIRGIISDSHVLATWHRPGNKYSGSGVLRLTIDAADQVMHGDGTWYSTEAQPGQHQLRWERVAT
jgi:hypothetical protein